MINIYSISITFAIVFLLFIIRLIQKNKLLERYSLFWILFALILIGLSITPYTIEKIANILDIKYAPSVLFIFGMIYIVIYSLHLTILFSKQSQKILKLTQELTLLKNKVEAEQ